MAERKNIQIPGESVLPVCTRLDCPVKNSNLPWKQIHTIPCDPYDKDSCKGLVDILDMPPKPSTN